MGSAFVRSVVALALCTLMAAGCRGKPGQDCSETPSSCSDSTSHLVCSKGKYVLETCRGPRGCSDDKALICDNSKAEVGDGCGHDGARACSVDATKEVRCRDSRFQIEWGCRGGCAVDANGNPKCSPMGEPGDVCRADSIVCDGAQKTQLACESGKLVPVRTCNGALGCKTEPGGGIRCDRTVADEGEACREEGIGACDRAKANVLVCHGGHFRPEMHCLGALGCELPGNYSVRCDKSIVEVGETCNEETAVSCSTDGKQVRCTSGRFEIDKTWKPQPDEACANRYRVSFETEKFEAR
jgi:hypothetical protein